MVRALSPNPGNLAQPAEQTSAVTPAIKAEFGQPISAGLGLRLPRNLSYEKWLAIGQGLAALNSSSSWCLGDWLIHGESAYTGRYRSAIDQTSLDYQTLRNYAWVARRFAPSRAPAKSLLA